MAGWRQALELVMTDRGRCEVDEHFAVSNRAGEPSAPCANASAYGKKPSFFAVGQRVGVHHQTVQRCIERALAYGPLMALDDRPRPGKEPKITPEAKAWLVSWRATRPRITAIRMSCGRRACWRAMRVSTGPPRDTAAWPILSKARCAKFLVKRKSNRIRCVLSGTPRCRFRAEDGGGSVRLSRGRGPEKGGGQDEE